MTITVLAENTSRGGLPTEHGLSLYIEANGKTLLFDTGQSDLFAKNAVKLGKDLEAVDLAVISHGHYDHGGGLETFLRINKTAPVYISRYAFEPHYNGERYIGLDTSLENSDRFVFTDGETQIAAGMTLYSAPDMETADDRGGLNMLSGGALVPDDFRHEQYLLIEENGRRILISGCSHRGIINISRYFRPDVLIGGFHLHKRALDDGLTAIGRTLAGFGIKYYTCHCTGTAQFDHIRPVLGNAEYISTGDSIVLQLKSMKL